MVPNAQPTVTKTGQWADGLKTQFGKAENRKEKKVFQGTGEKSRPSSRWNTLAAQKCARVSGKSE